MKISNNVDQNYILTILTVFSTFLMGFIDAYTFIVQNGVFASAQTGNIVALVAKLSIGSWGEALIHTVVFLGFVLGAFLGQAIVDRIKITGWRRYRVYLFYQTIFIFFVAFVQQYFGHYFIGFLLGMLAGYELTVFRQIKGTTINNGIMTGNVKNLMNDLYKALFNKNQKARSEFLVLLSGISIFMVGVGAGTFTLKLGNNYNLWTAFFITALFYFWLLASQYLKKQEKVQSKKSESI